MTRLYAVVLVVLLTGTAACSTFSKPKPPPTVTLDKAALQRAVRTLDQVFSQMFVVVNADCARLKKTRPQVYALVAADCPTLAKIKTLWDQAITDLTLQIAGASEGQTVDVEKLLKFLVELAALAAKLAVLV
jgi:hypothetical protein